MNPIVKGILIALLKVVEIIAPELRGICEIVIQWLTEQKQQAACALNDHMCQLLKTKKVIKPAVASPPDLVGGTD